jgi:hypothetical protein
MAKKLAAFLAFALVLSLGVGLFVHFFIGPTTPGLTVRVENESGAALASVVVSTDASRLDLGPFKVGHIASAWVPVRGDDTVAVTARLPSGRELHSGVYVSGDSCVVARVTADTMSVGTRFPGCFLR